PNSASIRRSVSGGNGVGGRKYSAPGSSATGAVIAVGVATPGRGRGGRALEGGVGSVGGKPGIGATPGGGGGGTAGGIRAGGAIMGTGGPAGGRGATGAAGVGGTTTAHRTTSRFRRCAISTRSERPKRTHGLFGNSRSSRASVWMAAG